MIGRRGPAHAKFTTKELRELGELPGVEVIVPATEADLDAFDGAGEGTATAGSDRRVRGNMVVIKKWAAGNAPGPAPAATPVPTGARRDASGDAHARTLTIRFWLRPVEITGDERVTGLVLERTRLDENGAFQGTGELETLEAQMVLRSVGYQSVPLDGVPFDERAAVVPNTAGRVLGPDGTPQPGEYVAGWLKRGPTGVIGTNKSDAAETVRSLLADLAGGSAVDDAALPRPGVLRYPDGAPAPAGSRVRALQEALARRGIRPVGYAEWLRVETAEAELARSLGRGERVKLPGWEALYAACWPPGDPGRETPADPD
jgi:ferredoxin/flavodoxin---NADP+ reductase